MKNLKFLRTIAVLSILTINLMTSSCTKDEPENVFPNSTWKVIMDASGNPLFSEGSLITFEKIGIVSFYKGNTRYFGEWTVFNDTLRIMDGIGPEYLEHRIEGPIKIEGKKATWKYSIYKCMECNKALKESVLILEKY